MKRTGKWIEGTSPEQPVSAAARLTIEPRLKLVAHYLPLAAKKAADDREFVHQLRVATRRATAALEIFSPLLPAKRLDKMKRRLKHIRRAAGDARDLDVLLARIEDFASSAATSNWDALLAELEAKRAAAQPPIEKIYRKVSDWNLPRRIQALVKRIRVRDESPAADDHSFVGAARAALSPLAGAFFTAILGPLSDLPSMHECRIQGKKLRYAMEIFSGAFPADFRNHLYPQVEQVQSLLGEINDRANACRHFTEWLAAAADAQRDPLIELLNAETAALEQARQNFLEWWNAERAQQMQDSFAEYLGTSRPVAIERTVAVG